jgi:ubiquinone/menaquinone biosynthesis C-methylase UbiE
MATSIDEISEQVKRQMNQPQIHETWEKAYRTEGNERCFELAYDAFVARISQPRGSHALDIGCGVCANSIRLAERGYIVTAADYSESILVAARANVAGRQLGEKITVARDDILKLSYPDEQFDLTLCWGVLMHVPDATRAISELVRVTKPGGYLVLEEANQNSPESRLMRLLWGTLRRKKIKITKAPAGIEFTSRFADETLFWRDANPHWLVETLASHNCALVHRGCSLFCELNMFMPNRFLSNAVHGWNRFWLRKVNWPQPAFHNVFLFRKGTGQARSKAAG